MKLARGIFVVLISCAAMVAWLVPVQRADATSLYDAAYETVDSLVLQHTGDVPPTPDCVLDVSASWPELMADVNNWTMYYMYLYLYPSFQNALDSGSWGVSLSEAQYGSVTEAIATVFWSDTRGVPFQWAADTVTVAVTGYVTIRVLYNDYTDSCRVIVGMSGGGASSLVISGEVSGETRYNFFASYYDPNYPVGYEGKEVRSEFTPTYVALGDSFSSGEGNPPFEYGTDQGGSNENRCHRSSKAYPRLLQNDPSLDLGSTAFVACSGATTADVLGGQWNEPAQVDALSAGTEVVTITIGGNDLGFSEVMQECSYYLSHTSGWGCKNDAGLQSSLEERMEALAGDSLSIVYGPGGKEIHSVLEVIQSIAAKAPDASIYIAGYPRLFGLDQGDFDVNGGSPSGYACQATLGVNYDYADAQWINDGVQDLNTLINDAVNSAHGAGIDVTYVPSTLFSGHGNCDWDSSWLYPIMITEPPASPGPTQESFHPTQTGQEWGYTAAFSALMN